MFLEDLRDPLGQLVGQGFLELGGFLGGAVFGARPPTVVLGVEGLERGRA